jgi:hypothetical protein
MGESATGRFWNPEKAFWKNSSATQVTLEIKGAREWFCVRLSLF